MEKIKLVELNNSLKPMGKEYYSLIENFISEDFVLTEENLHNFLVQLHNLDYQNKYEKFYFF